MEALSKSKTKRHHHHHHELHKFLLDSALIEDETPDEMISRFDNQPCEAIQKKINYFFMPYNKHFDCSKHMIFKKDEILNQINKY